MLRLLARRGKRERIRLLMPSLRTVDAGQIAPDRALLVLPVGAAAGGLPQHPEQRLSLGIAALRAVECGEFARGLDRIGVIRAEQMGCAP